MPQRLVNIDRDTPLLLPPDMRDWVPQDDIVHFILGVIDGARLDSPRLNPNGGGGEQYPPRMMLADTGYMNADAMERLEKEGHELYVAVGRSDNHGEREYDYRPRELLDKLAVSVKPPKDPRLLRMREKLETEEGKRIYNKRKSTVEPVFGIIKSAMGFRQCLLRGLEKVTGEWSLVSLAYNFRRLWNLKLAAA